MALQCAVLDRLVYTIRKSLWYWFVVHEWTWPQTHWRKWGQYERWLRAQEAP